MYDFYFADCIKKIYNKKINMKKILVIFIFVLGSSLLLGLSLPNSFVKKCKKYDVFMFDLDGTITINDGKNIDPKIIKYMISLMRMKKTIVLISGRSLIGFEKSSVGNAYKRFNVIARHLGIAHIQVPMKKQKNDQN